MFRIKRPTIEQIVILLFSILPIVDSINGILITRGLPSIGTVYKLLTLGVLFTFSLRKGCISRPVILSVILSAVYILLSVAANMLLLDGKLLSMDYPIKLFFNILTLAMLFNCVYTGYVDGNSFYRIL